jgi:hypothetical protein
LEAHRKANQGHIVQGVWKHTGKLVVGEPKGVQGCHASELRWDGSLKLVFAEIKKEER